MSTPHRIDFSLLDDDMKNMINASAKIFPVLYAYVSAGTNPQAYEYVRVTDGTHKHEVYIWDNTAWQLIGADDKAIDWTDVKNKPTTFTPTVHTHTKSQVTDFAHAHPVSEVTNLQTQLDGKADTAHNHDTAYAAKVHNHDTSYAPAGHDHDGRYYTESEADTLLGQKAALGHNHDTVYAVKATEGTVSNHETRLTNIESGYSTGHSHANLTVLNSITQALIDAWNSAVTHISDTVKHITSGERTSWNGAATHVGDATVHVTSGDKTTWNTVTGKADTSALTSGLAGKVDSTTFNGHTGNTTVHITGAERTNWNSVVGFGLGTSAADKSAYDLNTLKTTGFYRGANFINAPSGNTSWWYILVIAHDVSWVYQEATAYSDTSMGQGMQKYFRLLDNGTWSPWKKIWTEMSDGGGSGLMSDTVDGYHASDLTWYDGWVQAPGYNANTIGASKSGFTYQNNAPHNGLLAHFDAGGYGLQLNSEYTPGANMSFRTRNGDTNTWNGWKRLYHSGNVTKSTSNPSGGVDGDIWIKYTP